MRKFWCLLFLFSAVAVFTISCKKSNDPVTPITVDFTYTPDANVANSISFVANVAGDYDLIKWTIDGETVTGNQNVSHLFVKAGTYKVVLSAWKGLNEFKCEKDIVIAKNLLDFDFSAAADPSSANTINFNATIAGKYDKIVWDLGNTSTVNDVTSTSTTYPLAGTYKVKLSVWSQGVRFDLEKSVTISKNILDVAIVTEQNATDSYKYTFKANIAGTYSSLKWTIKGKTVNDATQVEGYFPFAGSSTVTLTVQSGAYSITATKVITNQTSDPDYASKLKLSWADEFDNSSLNSQNWSVETNIHVNNELQVYTSSGNYAIDNGVLTITCKKVNNDGAYGSYTSARLNSWGKKSFTYGRVEARLRLPKGKGTWPAFWMLGDNIGTGTSWPKCGETDIMEYVGYDPQWVQGSLHSQDFSGGNSKHGRYQLSASNDEGEWHTYGVIWQPDKISFYVDDYTQPYYTYNAPAVKTENNWPYDKPFFVLLNLAFGGDWGGATGIDKTLDNMKFDVDYVRYYSEP